MTPRPISCDEHCEHADIDAGIAFAAGKQFDQGDGEEDRHRIVGAGFDFQCRAHLVADVDAADTQQEEDGGRIRRGDDRAEQQAFEPAEIEKPHGGHGKEAGGQQHAHRGKGQRRDGSQLESLHRRAEAGIEENDGKRDRAEDVSKIVVAEFDAEPVDAREQADRQEEQKQRSTEAKGEQARKGRKKHERRRYQHDDIKCFHVYPLSLPSLQGRPGLQRFPPSTLRSAAPVNGKTGRKGRPYGLTSLTCGFMLLNGCRMAGRCGMLRERILYKEFIGKSGESRAGKPARRFLFLRPLRGRSNFSSPHIASGFYPRAYHPGAALPRSFYMYGSPSSHSMPARRCCRHGWLR